jgi:hypothetical protein
MRPLGCLVLVAAAAFAEEAKPEEGAATPQECFDRFKKAVADRDGAGFWTLLSKGSREVFEELGRELLKSEGEDREELATRLGVTTDELAEMTPRDVVVGALLAESNKESLADLDAMKLKDVKVEGDRATAERTEKDEKSEKAYFVREEGGWRLDLARELNRGETEDGKKDGK